MAQFDKQLQADMRAWQREADRELKRQQKAEADLQRLIAAQTREAERVARQVEKQTADWIRETEQAAKRAVKQAEQQTAGWIRNFESNQRATSSALHAFGGDAAPPPPSEPTPAAASARKYAKRAHEETPFNARPAADKAERDESSGPPPTKKPKEAEPLVAYVFDNSYLIYIIKHSPELLDFKPSSATLVKVGLSSLGSLPARFRSLQSKAYRVIPELYVDTPTTQYDFGKLQIQLGQKEPINGIEEIEDVVAILICDGDKTEVERMEDKVRHMIGGAPNDAMKSLMKDIVEGSGRNSGLHSYDMVVSDLNLLDALRKEWIQGRIRTYEDLANWPLLVHSEVQRSSVNVEFHLSSARSKVGKPKERCASSIVGYEKRARRPENERLYTSFGNPAPDIGDDAEEIKVRFEDGDGRQVYKYNGYYLTGQVRKWPTLATRAPAPVIPSSPTFKAKLPSPTPQRVHKAHVSIQSPPSRETR